MRRIHLSPKGRGWMGRIATAAFVATLFAMVFAALVSSESHGPAGTRIFFMTDPVGDDRGAGNVSYPQDAAFSPHSELLDLHSFEVRFDETHVYFLLRLGRLANPWNAPEGFFHPRIDIYIHTGQPGGRTEPLRQGPGIRFSSKSPWHVWLRVAPFEGSALFTWQDASADPGIQEGVAIWTIAHLSEILVQVDRSLMPPPSPSWKYYVLVGSFDGFGADGYRSVGEPGSAWLLGSADHVMSTRVVDLLAPRRGWRRQERQLRPLSSGETPTIYPVGNTRLPWSAPIGTAAVLMAVLFLMLRRIVLHRRGRPHSTRR